MYCVTHIPFIMTPTSDIPGFGAAQHTEINSVSLGNAYEEWSMHIIFIALTTSCSVVFFAALLPNLQLLSQVFGKMNKYLSHICLFM